MRSRIFTRLHESPLLTGLTEGQRKELARVVAERAFQNAPSLAWLFVCMYGGAAAGWPIMYFVMELAPLSAQRPIIGGAGEVLAILLGALPSAIAALAVSMWRTRLALRKAIAGGRCPRCGYELTGLPVEADCVKCPECALIVPRPALRPS